MYIPLTPPDDPAKLPAFLRSELTRLQAALGQPLPYVTLAKLPAAPVKPQDGMVVYADGAHWDPGSGVGCYQYRSGSWVKLG